MLAIEKRKLLQLKNLVEEWYTVVGDSAIKCVEQAIEALASIESLHFHINPRSAYANNITWIKKSFDNFQDMLACCRLHMEHSAMKEKMGKRAKKALETMWE
jgi:hypothetical protein